MRNLNSKNIDEMVLEDFLNLEFNQTLYKDFNEGLKPYFEETSLSFFKYIYRDVAYFYPNYNKISYDVDKHFDNKYKNEGRDLEFLIKRNIFLDIIQMVTTHFIYNRIDKYIPSFSDNFICGDNFPFLYKHYFRIEGPIEGHWHTSDFVDNKCNHRKEKKFHNDIDQVNKMKDFIESIDVNNFAKDGNSTKPILPTNLQKVAFLDKTLKKPASKSFEFPEHIANILAEALIRNEIIDEYQTTKAAIINALTLEWSEIKDKVFLKETTEFVAFLYIVKGNLLFKTLTGKNIESSKIFITPQGKILTYDNIRSSKRASKSRGTFEEKEKKMHSIVEYISQKNSLHNKNVSHYNI